MNKDYLETIRISSHETKSTWHRIFAGVSIFSITMWGLMLFPPLFGITLMFATIGFMTLGMKSYTLNLLTGKEPKIEHIFSKWRMALPAFCLTVVRAAYTILWGLCFIVPGIIACLNYSLASFIMCEDNSIDAFSAMAKSKKLVYNFRGKIFFLFLLYALLTIASLCLGGGIAILILKYTELSHRLSIMIGTMPTILTMLTLVMPFMHITYADVYLEAKAANITPTEKPKATSRKKKIS